MFDRHVQDHFFRVLPIARWGLRTAFEDVIELAADAKVICFDFRKMRPVERLVMRKGAIHRIDSEGKEMIKLFVCRSEAQRLTCDQIPVKCFEVAYIKDDPVS